MDMTWRRVTGWDRFDRKGKAAGTTGRARRRTTRRASVLLAALAAGLVAALAPAGAAGASGHRLPSFYDVPAHLPSGPPGRIVKSERIQVAGLHGTTYRVMYLSRTAEGKITPVTGLVIVPDTAPPAGGYPVVTWGHGTNGMATFCAPSLQPASSVPLANDLLDQGWEVTASDYQGEGTPGPLPYLVGRLAAQNTIDIVLAARQLHAAHASDRYIVWGHSEGGQTAMFALHIGAAYAPEIHMLGVVAGAPPSQFNLIYAFLKTSPYRFYLLMAADGFHAAYGSKQAPLSELLTAKGMALLPDLTKGCFNYLQSHLENVSIPATVKADPFSVPAWRALLEANDPESFTAASTAPLLMIQGGNDEQIPVASTQALASHLCGLGQQLERWIYPGQSHAGVIAPSMPDMIHWMADRFAGQTSPDLYQPTGLPGVQTTTCP